MYIYTYTVVGSGEFPLDMLHYDTSYPADGDAPVVMEQKTGGTRQVALEHRGPDKKWQPTEGRWTSFGWEVTYVDPPRRV